MRSAVVTVTQRSRRAAHGRRRPAPALPRPPNLILDLRALREGERHRREAGGVTVSGRPLAPARPRTYSPTPVGTMLRHRRALGTGLSTGLTLSLAGGDAAPSGAATVAAWRVCLHFQASSVPSVSLPRHCNEWPIVTHAQETHALPSLHLTPRTPQEPSVPISASSQAGWMLWLPLRLRPHPPSVRVVSSASRQ